MAADLQVLDRELWGAVDGTDLSIALVDLSDFSVIAVTKAFLSEVGLPPDKPIDGPAFNLVAKIDRTRAHAALKALAKREIDFYRGRRLLERAPLGPKAVVWACALDLGDRRVAMVELSLGRNSNDSPLVEYLGYSPPRKAVGVIDAAGVVTMVSANVDDVLGLTRDELLGRHLLETNKQRELCRQLGTGGSGPMACSVSLPLNSLDHLGGDRNVRCVITALVGSTSQFFILIPESGPATTRSTDRTTRLEHHLWRIASEVQASGIFDPADDFPDGTRFPQLNSLSARQWEVLSRLLRGERVPTIAKALYVSSSTVRNNLSAIFQKFGVHSQGELIELLGR